MLYTPLNIYIIWKLFFVDKTFYLDEVQIFRIFTDLTTFKK